MRRPLRRNASKKSHLQKSYFFLFFLFFESGLLVVNGASLQSKPSYRQALAASSWNCDALDSDSRFQSRGAAGGFKPALDPRSKICRVQRVGGKILHVANPEKSSGPREVYHGYNIRASPGALNQRGVDDRAQCKHVAQILSLRFLFADCPLCSKIPRLSARRRDCLTATDSLLIFDTRRASARHDTAAQTILCLCAATEHGVRCRLLLLALGPTDIPQAARR